MQLSNLILAATLLLTPVLGCGDLRDACGDNISCCSGFICHHGKCIDRL
ncbi:hypothetical protein Vi05172_g8092 [Venturia inaequalis]|nr:hypothetical protein Vi05172_g8092 [Venturia inaequalis]